MVKVEHEVLGVRLNDLSLNDLLETLTSFLNGVVPRLVVTPNPEFILRADQDLQFKDILSKADLSLPDGIGLKFAVAALYDDKRLVHRHTGGETLELLAELCLKYGKKMLILGGSGRDAAVVQQKFKTQYPGLDLVTCDPGIVDDEFPRLSEAITAKLSQLAPSVVVVALGQGRGRAQGKQEKVMMYLAKILPDTRIIIGVGGVIHVIANPHLRPPKSWSRLGLEWLWRLFKQPWRRERIFRAIILFPLLVVWTCLKERRLGPALRNVFKELKLHFQSPA